MLRSSLFTAGAFALVASASAQTPQALTAEKMPSALKHAGIYHVSTGTWTRTGGQVANFGPDVVYSNTAGSGYFSSAGGFGGFAPNSENFDSGGLPGSTNPGPGSWTTLPNRDEYSVNCIQIGYCDTNGAGTGGWLLNFYSNYAPCTLDTAPDAGVLVTGLPANGGCWLVDLDLTGGNEICLGADGLGDWDGDSDLDSFGWSYTYAGSAAAPGAAAGFLLSGNPTVTDPSYTGLLPEDGINTYYGATGGLCTTESTGYITQDFWWLEDPLTTSSGCYFFGGYSNNNGACNGPSNPYASWYMELSADTGACNTTFGDVYCNSNPNSTTATTGIELSGSQTAADDNMTVRGFDMPLNSFGFFIVSETPGFVANPAGSDGNLCVLGAIGRFVGAGQIQNAGTAGEVSLSTGTGPGTFSLTNMPTPTGPRMSVTGTTDHFQLWHRDSTPGGSNFSDGISHTWL